MSTAPFGGAGMGASAEHDELHGASEIIPGALYFGDLQQPFAAVTSPLAASSLVYYLDNDLIYEPFCADFGPCNLAQTYRFCLRVSALLEQGRASGQRVYLLVGSHPHKRSNAAALVGIFQVICLGRTPDAAYAPLKRLEPLTGFRDASCGVPTYQLSIYNAIRGMWRAKEVGLINWHKGEALNVEEYEHYEQVENGDLNWIVPGKLMAFSGPSAQPKHFGGWRTYMPEDYVQYFRSKGVTTVVRLNKKMYESDRFTAHGVKHHEMYFPDGTCPSEPILYRFLETVEKEPGALAVHCKAGLGRTGVLICCYMIKHFGFSAEEAMGYIRICRPGSVIGPQQHYLLHYAPRLLEEGAALRKAAGLGASPAAIHLTASSATVDTKTVRRSPRAAGGKPPMPPGAGGVAPAAGGSTTNTSALKMSRLEISEEPSYMMSVPDKQLQPAAAPNRPGHARGAPVHIHVDGDANSPPPRTLAPVTLPAAVANPGSPVPSGKVAVAAASGTMTPPPASATRAPPSSTKRMLAPNGQPRKIPMAMDFDEVAAQGDLEDREPSPGSDAAAPEDSWKVGSRPAADRSTGNGRVGAFAAAAGRGASAFVEAFRHAVGNYRHDYTSSRRT